MVTEIGKVVSVKMNKTVVVKVTTKVQNPLYKKQVTKFRTYKAHDELDSKVGQTVKIQETKPYSKQVHFNVIEVINNEKGKQK